jgi:hypothetical protein
MNLPSTYCTANASCHERPPSDSHLPFWPRTVSVARFSSAAPYLSGSLLTCAPTSTRCVPLSWHSNETTASADWKPPSADNFLASEGGTENSICAAIFPAGHSLHAHTFFLFCFQNRLVGYSSVNLSTASLCIQCATDFKFHFFVRLWDISLTICSSFLKKRDHGCSCAPNLHP